MNAVRIISFHENVECVGEKGKKLLPFSLFDGKYTNRRVSTLVWIKSIYCGRFGSIKSIASTFVCGGEGWSVQNVTKWELGMVLGWEIKDTWMRAHALETNPSGEEMKWKLNNQIWHENHGIKGNLSLVLFGIWKVGESFVFFFYFWKHFFSVVRLWWYSLAMLHIYSMNEDWKMRRRERKRLDCISNYRFVLIYYPGINLVTIMETIDTENDLLKFNRFFESQIFRDLYPCRNIPSDELKKNEFVIRQINLRKCKPLFHELAFLN